ncbi:hypothetical protein C8258_02140 [Nocardia sp. MDA0666]|nr:hypothetical protein C8258_02140 [Nocardia sp. MDA0666]
MLTVLTCSAATVPVASGLRRGCGAPTFAPALDRAFEISRFTPLELRGYGIARISAASDGASSSPNSSGTGQFPFGKGLGDAAPGGVPSAPSHGGTADNNYPFSTN